MKVNSLKQLIRAVSIKIRALTLNNTRKLREKTINKNDFTIISNNCWGGRIYSRYNLTYNSPTVGLFIMPDEYIKLIYNLKYYLTKKLEFIEPKESRYYEYLCTYPKFEEFPIGKLDDIEIVFLHYGSREEAFEKWNRRSKRINWNRIIIKFCDQNLCEYKHLKLFDELNYPNKICFTSKPYPELGSVTYLKSARGRDCVGIEDELYLGTKSKEITNFINALS